MIDLNRIPTTYADAVNLLVAWHSNESADPVSIYLLPDPDERTVRFVEVGDDFGDDLLARPITMGASRDFPFPTSIMLLSKKDWDLVKAGGKALPEGWDLRELRPIAPPTMAIRSGLHPPSTSSDWRAIYALGTAF